MPLITLPLLIIDYIDYAIIYCIDYSLLLLLIFIIIDYFDITLLAYYCHCYAITRIDYITLLPLLWHYAISFSLAIIIADTIIALAATLPLYITITPHYISFSLLTISYIIDAHAIDWHYWYWHYYWYIIDYYWLILIIIIAIIIDDITPLAIRHIISYWLLLLFSLIAYYWYYYWWHYYY